MHIPSGRKEPTVKATFTPFVKLFAAHSKVLDVACGHGFVMKMLKEANIDAVGIEMDEGLVNEARSSGLKVIQGDIFHYLQSTQEKFNGCIASHIVEHFPPQKVVELLRLMNRVTLSDGKLLIITPNIAHLRRAAGDFWRDPSHVRPYPIEALDKLLSQTEWRKITSGYLSDKKFSLRKTIVSSIRNVLIGRYWLGEDLYMVAQKL